MKVRIKFFEEKHNEGFKQVKPNLVFHYTPGKMHLFSQAYIRATPQQTKCNKLEVTYL